MNRLNKKCIVASTGVHLLIGLVAFVGPAFTSSTPKQDTEPPFLNFEPDILTDSDKIGGGNSRAGRPPEAVPQPPVPKPQPEPPKPEPKPVQPVKTAEPKPQAEQRPDPENFDTPPPKKKKPNISTTAEVMQKPSNKAPAQETEAKQRKDQLANVGKVFADAGQNIREHTGGATSIREVGSYGPGGGGPSYASYAAYVRTLFDRAWIAPEETSVDAATAEVRVTIARDGTVLSAEFERRSGDRQVDASIQRALDRVPTIGRPFPEGAKENKRTYILLFDLKVKRGLA